MDWEFGGYTLSRDRAELTGPDGPVKIERQPLDLLILLAENAERVVTRDEIIDVVWSGRIVSDATVSTAVKQARKAVGDNGAEQSVIKTIHGRGFRFVAPLADVAPPAPASAATAAPPAPDSAAAPAPADQPPIGSAQATLAVLRFQFFGSGVSGPGVADAIPSELIASLSRLRWLHVIARGSSFRFDPNDLVPEEVGARLGVRYLLSGSVEAISEMLTISVEILSAADGTLIWSDRFATTWAEVQLTRQDIVASTISALELHVPRFEAEHARFLTPAQFDAWTHYHLGLRYMYRYNQADNARAAEHFRSALGLDAEFARAHAGLSFTHWQGAFMYYGADRAQFLSEANLSAGRALDIDPHDPFASFCMGRARWLEGDLDAGVDWMDRALSINPNFAQCHYNRGLVKSLGGSADEADHSADRAMSLSPLDPLLYAMYSTKALAAAKREDWGEAHRQMEHALQAPGAHFYISLLAGILTELAGNREKAELLCSRARSAGPALNQSMFFRTFPFADEGLRRTLAGSLTRLGID